MKHVLTLLLIACSCMVSAQSEYCLDGTVWDAALGGCVPEVLACEVEFDFDGDGSVGSSDLLAFLGGFGGTFPDTDSDGVCDDIDECVGEYDECGVCNGPGAVYACGCLECSQCGDPVSHQGYDYTTVLIGDQCWFAENLRSENYANGDAIPSNLSDSDWQNATSGGMAVYGEEALCYTNSPDIDACDPTQSLNEYGRLYNWYAVDDARGLCPSGWHVPTDGEWTVMTDYLGGETIVAGQMKTDYGWNDGNGTNASGFSGLPGGNRSIVGDFINAGHNAFLWSSSVGDSDVWTRSLSSWFENVSRTEKDPRNGFSIRCLQDAE